MSNSETFRTIPEPLQGFLGAFFKVELFWYDFPDGIKRCLARDAAVADLFKKQFADAILNSTVTPEQYNQLTGERFSDPAALSEWLRELWGEIYGDEPIPGEE